MCSYGNIFCVYIITQYGMDKYILGLSQKHSCDFKRVAEELKRIAGCDDLNLPPELIEQRYRVLTGQKVFKIPELPSSYLSECDDEPEELFIVPSHHLITDYVFDEALGPVPRSKKGSSPSQSSSDSEEDEKQSGPTLQWTTQL